LRILYRARQFWHALSASPTREDLALARSVLTSAQMTAFSRLQSNEQYHAIAVLRKLKAQGEVHPDLQVAALLHDIGKSQVRLKPWERALIVLAEAIAPQKVKQWGTEGQNLHAQSAFGWRRALVVSEGHAEWGAQIAHEAGVSPLAERLIRRHQEAPPDPPQNLEDRLLHKLQSADNES
jgi:putative nucleotidyltransferase with HDIG domain